MNKVFEQLKREARTALEYTGKDDVLVVSGRAQMAHQLGAITLDEFGELYKMLQRPCKGKISGGPCQPC